MADSNKPLRQDHDDIVLPRRPYWQWTLAAAGVTGLLSWLALLPPSTSNPDAPANVLRPAPPAAALNPAPAPERRGQPTDARPEQRQPAPAPRDHPKDLQALASDNPGDRIEALRSIRDRKAVELLPQLLSRDPAADPDAAPTLIAVSTDLARNATADQRTVAATTLGEWLESELQRSQADARANVSVLVEALGRLESPESVRALIEALDSDHLSVHVATLAARGLEKLGDPAARDAVERFRARVAGAPAADGFARELNAEALAAANSALARWSH